MKHKINLKSDAIEIMKNFGPVHAGSPSGDFNVRKISAPKGWVVFYDHLDILNFVSPDELSLPDQIDENKISIGLIGREKRKSGASSLKIIYVHEKNQ